MIELCEQLFDVYWHDDLVSYEVDDEEFSSSPNHNFVQIGWGVDNAYDRFR